MPGILTFNSADVKALIEVAKASSKRRLEFTQMALDDTYWRDDLTPERRALLESEIKENDLSFSVTSDDIDQIKAPPALWLVGDDGIYLSSCLI